MSRVNAQKTGQLIRQQRTAIGMTQKKLADELNVTDKAISKWENGDGLPDISILIQLAAKLQITTDELLAGSVNETEDNDLQIEQTDNPKINDSKERLASERTSSNLVFLSLALCLTFYLALSQITGQFSSWFANQFIIDNGFSASIFTAFPGLLLNQIYLISILLLFFQKATRKSSHHEKSRLLPIIILVSGFVISFINFWFGTTGLMFEYGSHFLIGLTLLLLAWQQHADVLRVFSGLTGLSLIGELVAHIILLTSQNSSIGVRIAVLPLIINRGMTLLLWVLIYVAIIKERVATTKDQTIDQSS